jgi:magnesium chelatase subunit I
MEAIYAEGGLVLYDESSEKEYQSTLDSLPALNALISKYQSQVAPKDTYFLKEFVLWALAEHQKLGKERLTDGFQFKDLLNVL